MKKHLLLFTFIMIIFGYKPLHAQNCNAYAPESVNLPDAAVNSTVSVKIPITVEPQSNYYNVIWVTAPDGYPYDYLQTISVSPSTITDGTTTNVTLSLKVPPLPGDYSVKIKYSCSGYMSYFGYVTAYGKALPPAPTTPTLSVSSTGSTDCSLFWTLSNYATNYNVYQDGNLILKTTQNGATISNLCMSKHYTFYVTASNNTGTSGASNVVNVNTTVSGSTAINGPDLICSSGSIFSIANLPSSSTVIWSGQNLTFPYGNTGSSITVTPVSSYSAGSTLIAQINTSCGGQFQVTKFVNFNIDKYATAQVPSTHNGIIKCLDLGADYTIPEDQGWFYEWQILSNNCSVYQEGCRYLKAPDYDNVYKGSVIWLKRLNRLTENIAIGLRVYSPECGGTYSHWNIYEMVYEGTKFASATLSLSPNPSADNVKVSIDEQKSISEDDVNLEYNVQISDMFGKLVYETKKKGRTFTIPVHNIRNGNYILEVSDGKESIKKQLLVNHN